MAIYPNGYPQYESIFTDCIAYYDMNGDAKDVTNNNNDGTVSGATLTTDRFGIADRAYDFSGSTSGVISLPNILSVSSGQAVTVAFFMKTGSTSPNNQWIIGNQTGSSSPRFIFGVGTINPSKAFMFADNGSSHQELDSITSVNDGNWHFILGARDSSGNNKLYVDGSLEASGTVSGSLDTAQDWFIGKYFGGTTISYAGIIGETFVWKRALSADEVSKLYNITKSKYIYEYPRQVGE